MTYFLTQITRTTDAFASVDPPAALTPLALRKSRTVSGVTSAACAAGTPLASPASKTALDLTGIADPQNQGGGGAVSSVKASVAQLGGSSDVALSPPPALGFSGAAALDGDGKFAGIALLKPVVVAGPANGAAQAVLVTSDAVRDFLKANGVTGASGSPDAKASVVRVICVRK